MKIKILTKRKVYQLYYLGLNTPAFQFTGKNYVIKSWFEYFKELYKYMMVTF